MVRPRGPRRGNRPDDEEQAEQAASPRLSRTARKRAAEEIYEFAVLLSKLPASTQKSLPLGDALQEALDTARKLSKRGSHKRQLKIVAGLLRDANEEANGELEAIRAAYAQL